MQLHDLKSKDEKDKKRVGRGGARGTYCGRGVKGQKARAGSGGEPLIRRIIKRYPKLRGYRRTSGRKNAVVNVGSLENSFEDGEKTTPKALVEKGLIRRKDGKIPPIKILGEGKLENSLTIESCQVSASAEKKIKKAGGTV